MEARSPFAVDELKAWSTELCVGIAPAGPSRVFALQKLALLSGALDGRGVSVTQYPPTTNTVYHPQNTAASKACEVEAKAHDRT